MYIVSSVQPTEIYNLAAQSHVKVSFDMAEYTVSSYDPLGEELELMGLQGDVDGLGTLRLLDAIRTCGLTHHVRFYQVSHQLFTRRSGLMREDRLLPPSCTAKSSRLLSPRRLPSTLVLPTE